MKLTWIPPALYLALAVSLTGRNASAAETSLGGSERIAAETSQRSGNPILKGWYADPEAAIFGNQYWIYPTYSAPYDEQVFFDAFSSPDLVHWTKHSRILDTNRVTWARRAMWAPAVAERQGKYYFFFG